MESAPSLGLSTEVSPGLSIPPFINPPLFEKDAGFSAGSLFIFACTHAAEKSRDRGVLPRPQFPLRVCYFYKRKEYVCGSVSSLRDAAPSLNFLLEGDASLENECLTLAVAGPVVREGHGRRPCIVLSHCGAGDQ